MYKVTQKYGMMGEKTNLFLTSSCLILTSSKFHAPAALIPRGRPMKPVDRRLGLAMQSVLETFIKKKFRPVLRNKMRPSNM
jgi:hypothetical protein